jgi:hypothetical protein
MNINFKDYLLKVTNSSECAELEVIQSLWSGYGKVSRYRMDNSQHNTVVVKFISLNQAGEHPRGWSTGFSHNRKVESYKVETNWYEKWNMQCISNCRTPKFLGSFSEGTDQWIIMEDLNIDFPIQKQELDLLEIKVCLKWLANFHITFLAKKPTGLWEIGTYWNLETRPEEFEKIENIELKSKAELIDQLLNECKYKTIVHGDAKLANFCFSVKGESVAAVDFQYVGGGCGIKDIAYFLGSCLSSFECELYQNELLDYYFSELEKAFKLSEFNFDFKELENEWRSLYPIACTDFTRFMLGWMPSHQKVNNYSLNIMKAVLLRL